MFTRIGAAFLALSAVAAPDLASAQTSGQERSGMQDNSSRIRNRADDILAVLQQSRPAEEVFSPDFITAITPAQLRVFAEQMEAGAGPLQSVKLAEPDGDAGTARIVLRFAKALGKGSFQLESREPYRVTGFRITEFEPIDDSIEALTAEFRALPGEVGVYFGPVGSADPVFAINPDQPFAIGSAFKLDVLAALSRAVAEGRHRWEDVVALDRKSLPSGMMQDWPDGAPVTLHTLATLMISISDNTATDQLIHLLGREAVEAENMRAGNRHADRNRPFLTTRELFVLKAGTDAQLAQYAAASEADRRTMLANIAQTLPSSEDIERAFADGPRALNVEWFASPRDIDRMFRHIIDQGDSSALAILAINPGTTPLPGDRWEYVGYKGGSEPGVLNLSWLLRDKQGQWWTLIASWNNQAATVDQSRFVQLARRLLLMAPTASGDSKP